MKRRWMRCPACWRTCRSRRRDACCSKRCFRKWSCRDMRGPRLFVVGREILLKPGSRIVVTEQCHHPVDQESLYRSFIPAERKIEIEFEVTPEGREFFARQFEETRRMRDDT